MALVEKGEVGNVHDHILPPPSLSLSDCLSQVFMTFLPSSTQLLTFSYSWVCSAHLSPRTNSPSHFVCCFTPSCLFLTSCLVYPPASVLHVLGLLVCVTMANSGFHPLHKAYFLNYVPPTTSHVVYMKTQNLWHHSFLSFQHKH